MASPLMPDHVLITGGAGFIGSHVADQLLGRGHRVRVLDNLSPQVHGPARPRPPYLDEEVELIVGDVRDHVAVARALTGVDTVLHLAARVGVGQSMHEISEYTSVNNGGTAVLLEALAQKPVRRLVVASSMTVYGEGLYKSGSCARVAAVSRSLEQLQRGDWEIRGEDGHALIPLATPEWKTPALESVYALSKYDQERLCLLVGRANGISTIALRFSNVYGPRQALSNPYTGVLSTFAARLLNDRAPLIFEDGKQRRDFVSVHDAAMACCLALDAQGKDGRVLNIGSGHAETILEIARHLSRALGRPFSPEMSGRYRAFDVRHCFADITAAARDLGYAPQVPLEIGLRELATFMEGKVLRDDIDEGHDARGAFP